MFTESNKLFNVVLFVIMAIAMLAINSAAYAGEYEDKAKALSISFEQFCSNVDARRIRTANRYNARAYMKARLLQLRAVQKIRACGSDKVCVKKAKYNSIKEMHSDKMLKMVGYFSWTQSTLDSAKAEAESAGFIE